VHALQSGENRIVKSGKYVLLEVMEESDRAGEKRIAILGSGKGSNARAILEAEHCGKLGARIALILSDRPGVGILEVAGEYGVPARVVNPGTSRGGVLSDEALAEILRMVREAEIDLIACAGFMRILRDPLLSAFPGRILNVHPSLLPKYPGLKAVARALEAGEKETGCTVHLVDAGVDTGRILSQKRVPIRGGDTVESLTARIHEAEHQAYVEVIAGW